MHRIPPRHFSAQEIRRRFAAWLGFTPRANSSDGKERLGGITKTVMRMTRKNADRQPWMAQLLERKPAKIATVALANKTARIAWASDVAQRSLRDSTCVTTVPAAG